MGTRESWGAAKKLHVADVPIGTGGANCERPFEQLRMPGHQGDREDAQGTREHFGSRLNSLAVDERVIAVLGRNNLQGGGKLVGAQLRQLDTMLPLRVVGRQLERVFDLLVLIRRHGNTCNASMC